MNMIPLRPEKDKGEMSKGNPQLRIIFSVYVGLAVCGIGLVGNLISVLVWKRLNRKRSDSGKSAGIFLIAMAFVDSGLLIFFILFESIPELVPSIMHKFHYVQFYCYFLFPMYFFFIVASIWMVISITYNRFVAVVFPHKAASLNTLKKSYIIVACTLVFSFIINLPHFFNFRPIQENDGSWTADSTKYGKSKAATEYDFVAHCMLLVLIPWVIVLVLNSVIIYKLCKNKDFRASTGKGKMSKERQTTMILLAVTFAFMLFLIWQCITQCFYMLHFKENNAQVWFHVDGAYAPARLGVIINSSINFILYCLTGSMFRKEMYRMFAEWFCCNNYLVLLDTSTTISRTASQSTMRSVSPQYYHHSNNIDAQKTV